MLKPGSGIGHFRVVAKLGQGGMGEVYRAHDQRLDRDVAIKVLPAEMANDPDRLARFEREAKALAKLAHPNILAVYEVDVTGIAVPDTEDGEAELVSALEGDGETGRRTAAVRQVHYLVTELLEGETLRERIEQGAVPWRKAVEITAAMADGLAAAHAQGIIHRDLKPENVFLTSDGRVKVLDFGLARVQQGPLAEVETLTSPPPGTAAGTVLGTVGYMSPEQVRGEATDHRSDIFALGCVLHEMLTGRPPFKRDTAVESMSAILKEDPPEVSLSGIEVMPELNRVLGRCLEKHPAQRFQSAADLAFALRTLLSGSVGVAAAPRLEADDGAVPLSIAVLPFANRSPDPDSEYFADGLTEELITDLAHIRSLRVISRSSAMRLKGSERATGTIGRDLGVHYVLEGSVRKAGSRLRITAQLIDAKSEVHLWADRFDGVLEDVFDMQEQVSRSIADALKLTLSPEEQRRVAERPITNVQAYECYLRARQETWLATPDALARAERHLKRGQEIIGENALLLAGLAYVYHWYVNIGVKHEEYIGLAVEHANRALSLDPECAEAELVLGLVHQAFSGDQAGGIEHFKRALGIRPDDADTLLWLVVTYSVVGRLAEARPLAERLLVVDPLTPISRYSEVFCDVFGGTFTSSVEALTSWVRMEPDNPAALICGAWFLALSGRLDESCHLVEQHASPDAEDFYTAASIMLKQAAEKNVASLRTLLTDDARRTAERDPMHSHIMADIHALAGMRDEALDWLKRGLNRGWVNYPFTARHDRLLASLHVDSRFQSTAARMRQAWEQSEG